MTSPLTRREAITKSLSVTSVLALSQTSLNFVHAEEVDSNKTASPNDLLSVAVMGSGGRGGEHIKQFTQDKRTRITHICDCDEGVGQKKCDQTADLQGGHRPIWIADVRDLLEVKEIDIVSIATPNHWHSLGAIWAIQAGKDVYVEKPISHNVWEGRQVAIASNKYSQIVQCGTQCRSNSAIIGVMAFIHGGGIGDVKIARGLCYKNRPSIGARGIYSVPEGVNYDLWCGPTQTLPITRPRFHYDWHWQWEWGNGDLGNQGIHQVDLCRWALQQDALSSRVFSYGGRFGYEDAGETANTQVSVFDYGDKQLVFEVRGLPSEGYRGSTVGVVVEGTQGSVVIDSYGSATAFDPTGEIVKSFRGGDDRFHFANFIDCVQSRDKSKLNASATEGHLSSALCHLGNISYRSGNAVNAMEVHDVFSDLKRPEEAKETFDRTMKHLADNGIEPSSLKMQIGGHLQIDAAIESFIGNQQANEMLNPEARKGFEIQI